MGGHVFVSLDLVGEVGGQQCEQSEHSSVLEITPDPTLLHDTGVSVPRSQKTNRSAALTGSKVIKLWPLFYKKHRVGLNATAEIIPVTHKEYCITTSPPCPQPGPRPQIDPPVLRLVTQ